MNRIILLLIAITIGLSANADYTVQTYQPLVPSQPIQPIDYTTNQPYMQTYNQQYSPTYNQPYYQNPYQVQSQTQCVNPYQYQNPYTYGSNIPYSAINAATSSIGSGGVAPQIMKNIGKSMLYSMLRGY